MCLPHHYSGISDGSPRPAAVNEFMAAPWLPSAESAHYGEIGKIRVHIQPSVLRVGVS